MNTSGSTWRELERNGRGSGGEYQADAQRILRVSLMNRCKCQEGARHRGDVAESSRHSEFLSSRCSSGLRTSLSLIIVLDRRKDSIWPPLIPFALKRKLRIG
jgi:hypothetical protein